MPIPAAALAIIGSGISGGSNIAGNAMANRAQREQSRLAMIQGNIGYGQQQLNNQRLWEQQNQWDLDMWNRQNEYNLQLWNMQNKYNSPVEQMARFREAGLNPNLIYGQGNMADAVRTTPMDSNRQPAPDAVGYSPAQVSSITRGLDVFSDYSRLRMLNAQVDNIEAQTDVAQQEALVKAQDRVLKSLNIRRGEVAYDVERGIADYSVEAARMNLENLQNSVRKSAAEADVSVGTKDSRIAQARIEVNKAMKELTGQALLNRLRELEVNLNEHGVQKSDNVILRMIMQPENYKFLNKIKSYIP